MSTNNVQTTTALTNNDQYSRFVRRQQLFEQMANAFTGEVPKGPPPAGSPLWALGRANARRAQAINPNQPDRLNPFGLKLPKPEALQPQDKQNSLPPVNFDRLARSAGAVEEPIAPQNAIQARLFKLAGVGQDPGVSLTGPQADANLDAKFLALQRGVKLQDASVVAMQKGLITPYMQELIRGFWMPNLPMAYFKDTEAQYFRNFLDDIQQSFANVEDSTTKRGAGGQFTYMFSGGFEGGAQTGAGSGGGGGDMNRRPFRWNG
jgi:hypothetical protein